MSQPVTSHTINGSVNSTGEKTKTPTPEQSNHQPNVRHIPIFVEGRDEPVINRNLDTSASGEISQASGSDKGSPGGGFGEPGSLFNRVKRFPVLSNFDSELFQQSGARSASPGRTIPIKVNHQTPQSNTKATEVPDIEKKSPVPHNKASGQVPRPEPKHLPKEDFIEKIEKILKDVLSLMNQVEKFTGTSRKDKQYIYLDEMLTQNLLKLDTIDADGNEKVKLARRSAIKCINECITALEQKTDAAATAAKNSEASQESSKVANDTKSETSQA